MTGGRSGYTYIHTKVLHPHPQQPQKQTQKQLMCRWIMRTENSCPSSYAASASRPLQPLAASQQAPTSTVAGAVGGSGNDGRGAPRQGGGRQGSGGSGAGNGSGGPSGTGPSSGGTGTGTSGGGTSSWGSRGEGGGGSELNVEGMLYARFLPNGKLGSLEMMFDVMTVMQQLQRAAGVPCDCLIVPNSLEAACQRSATARYVCMLLWFDYDHGRPCVGVVLICNVNPHIHPHDHPTYTTTIQRAGQGGGALPRAARERVLDGAARADAGGRGGAALGPPQGEHNWGGDRRQLCGVVMWGVCGVLGVRVVPVSSSRNRNEEIPIPTNPLRFYTTIQQAGRDPRPRRVLHGERGDARAAGQLHHAHLPRLPPGLHGLLAGGWECMNEPSSCFLVYMEKEAKTIH